MVRQKVRSSRTAYRALTQQSDFSVGFKITFLLALISMFFVFIRERFASGRVASPSPLLYAEQDGIIGDT